MLISKEEELDKMKGRKASVQIKQNSPESPVDQRAQSYDLDSGYESSVSVSLKKSMDFEKERIKETLNIDYIKNVFIKYLQYRAENNEKEAITMEKVLFTVLKASEKDIEVIEKAR